MSFSAMTMRREKKREQQNIMCSIIINRCVWLDGVSLKVNWFTMVTISIISSLISALVVYSQKLKNIQSSTCKFIYWADSCKLTNQYELYFSWRFDRTAKSTTSSRLLLCKCHRFFFFSISIWFFMSLRREKWCEQNNLCIRNDWVENIVYDLFEWRHRNDIWCVCDFSLLAGFSSSNGTKTIQRSQLIASKVIERMTDGWKEWIDRMLILPCVCVCSQSIRGWMWRVFVCDGVCVCICLPKNIEKLLNGCITAAHHE